MSRCGPLQRFPNAWISRVLVLRVHKYWAADAGALELLQSGELSAEHWDWECGAGFSFTRDEDIQENGSAKASSKEGNG